MTELLELSTIVKPKDTVSIKSKLHPKGRSYDLVNLGDLGPIEYHTLLERNAVAESLGARTKRTSKQEATLASVLGDILKILAPSIEPSVVAQLSIAQRSMIVATWAASKTAAASASAEGKARRRRTTAASSRRSKGSTAATRKPGSTPPRG